MAKKPEVVSADTPVEPTDGAVATEPKAGGGLHAARKAAWDAQGGKCYVSGQELDPWGTATEWRVTDGKAVTASVAKAKDTKDWEGFRAGIAKKLAQAHQTIADYQDIVDADGNVVFYGERPVGG